LLDEENIKIIRTMKQQGPRNLQRIARASKIPYTTVYSRVSKLEGAGLFNTYIHPNYSRIGLSQAVVLVTPFPGRELLAKESIKIAQYWLKIARCIGECNGYFALVAVPSSNTRDFQEYMEQLVARGVIRSSRVTWLGESTSPIPNFDYYDFEKKTWNFDWKRWFGLFKRRDKIPPRTKPAESSFDKRDLIILKELTKDARTTLVTLAKMLSISLPAAKYRFEGLVEKGLIEDYVINVLPFAYDLSDLSEVRLDFKDESSMRIGEKSLSELPFVLTISPVRGLNSLSVRTYIPRVELNNLMNFLSLLVKENILVSFSYLQLDPMTLTASTIGYKAYSDETGWYYDNRKFLDAVDNLVSNWERREPEAITLPALPIASLQ
jgi:DNA-binding Lrp family transcriptional regulator